MPTKRASPLEDAASSGGGSRKARRRVSTGSVRSSAAMYEEEDDRNLSFDADSQAATQLLASSPAASSVGGGARPSDAPTPEDNAAAEERRMLLSSARELGGDDDDMSDGENESCNEDDEDDAMDDEPRARSECGVVLSIYCMDFMCHRHLEVHFNPRINFITGQNGSGKSAIIAALQICLGMNAKDTHRGKKLNSLIRHGARGNAVVKVKLNNQGPDAYLPEEYGKKITIERTIYRSGSSSYTLRNGETDAKISNKKSDLDEITERFSLFVDNPCCILDQESSKLFLKGKAADKYALFLKASQLQTMMQHYISENQQRVRAMEVIKDKEADLALLEAKHKQAEAKVDELQALEKHQDRKWKEQLTHEIAWAVVKERKDMVADLESTLKSRQDKLSDCESVLRLAQEDYDEKVKLAESHKEREDELKARESECRKAFGAAKKAVNETKGPIKKSRTDFVRSKNQAERFELQRDKIKVSCRELREKGMKDAEETEQRINSKILELESEQNELYMNKPDKSRMQEQIEMSLYKLEDDDRQLRADIEESQRRIQMYENSKRGLLKQAKDANVRYGDHMPKMLSQCHTRSERECGKVKIF